jgi:hypothetical protein
MSDEELVKRLRDLGDRAAFEPHMHHEAADRIEELLAERKKAVDAFVDLAFATLAEISSHNKGESHDPL